MARTGHKKKPEYDTREEAFEAIASFEFKPTIVNHSGGGFHCYWVLKHPLNVAEIGEKTLASINKSLLLKLKADTGTQNINRLLRVPGTYNLKLPENPREVTVVIDDGPLYDYEDLKPLLNSCEKPKAKSLKESAENQSTASRSTDWDQKISSLAGIRPYQRSHHQREGRKLSSPEAKRTWRSYWPW